MVTVDSKISSVLNRNFSKATSDVNKVLSELSSGKKKLDPASAAIVEELAREISTSKYATRNISDGVSAIQIADGAAESISTLNGRLSELATASANGTLTDTDRQSLDQEFQSTLSEINRIQGSTTFNGQQLLGSSSNLQTGTSTDANSQTQLNIANLNTTSLGLSGQSIATQSGAQSALTAAKAATDTISQARSELGATENRLQVAFDNLKTAQVNNESARSSIQDVDYAESSSKLLDAKIRQQGSASLYSLSNQINANVIQTLLRA